MTLPQILFGRKTGKRGKDPGIEFNRLALWGFGLVEITRPTTIYNSMGVFYLNSKLTCHPTPKSTINQVQCVMWNWAAAKYLFLRNPREIIEILQF